MSSGRGREAVWSSEKVENEWVSAIRDKEQERETLMRAEVPAAAAVLPEL